MYRSLVCPKKSPLRAEWSYRSHSYCSSWAHNWSGRFATPTPAALCPYWPCQLTAGAAECPAHSSAWRHRHRWTGSWGPSHKAWETCDTACVAECQQSSWGGWLQPCHPRPRVTCMSGEAPGASVWYGSQAARFLSLASLSLALFWAAQTFHLK